MIRINLAKKPNKGGGIDLKNLNLGSIRELLNRGGEGGEGQKLDLNNPIVRTAIAIAVCWYVGSYLDDVKTAELAKVDKKIADLESEKSKVLARLGRIKGWEPIKKQLEDDEKGIRLKLDVVRKLLDDRTGPAKLLMQVSQSIPEQVWLTKFDVQGDKVKFSGETTDADQVTDFIKSLNSATQLSSDVSLNGMSLSNSDKDMPVQVFELSATRRRGGN